jgi:hypothetical protein
LGEKCVLVCKKVIAAVETKRLTVGTVNSTAEQLISCRELTRSKDKQAKKAVKALAAHAQLSKVAMTASAAETPPFMGPMLPGEDGFHLTRELSISAEALEVAIAAASTLYLSTNALRKASADAWKAAEGAAAGWAVDVPTILTRPASSGVEKEELHRFCTEKLKLDMTANRVLMGDCTVEQLNRAIKDWYEEYDVHPENIDTVEVEIVEAQLRARFPDGESRQGWIDRHMEGDPTVADPCVLLRKVIVFSEKLDH